LAKKYWPLLAKWADYLVAHGLDPENQLCSADMFGHLPHCANLALKASRRKRGQDSFVRSTLRAVPANES
jgi:hypothetical protein